MATNNTRYPVMPGVWDNTCTIISFKCFNLHLKNNREVYLGYLCTSRWRIRSRLKRLPDLYFVIFWALVTHLHPFIWITFGIQHFFSLTVSLHWLLSLEIFFCIYDTPHLNHNLLIVIQIGQTLGDAVFPH